MNKRRNNLRSQRKNYEPKTQTNKAHFMCVAISSAAVVSFLKTFSV